MKNDEAIRSLNYGLVSDYYPPFTKVLFRASDGSEKETTISEIISLKDEIGETPLMVKIEGDDWKLLSETNILESPVQAHAPLRPPRDHESVTEPEPVTLDDTRPVVDSTAVDAWIKRRDDHEEEINISECNNQYEIWSNDIGAHLKLNSDVLKYCTYFDADTNIDIVYEVLRREAKSGSNVYLNIDHAHGSLAHQETSLNSNLHLLVIPARGSPNYGFLMPKKGVLAFGGEAFELMIMKIFLEDGGDEDLFNIDPNGPYMTLRGSLLFYTLSLLHMMDPSILFASLALREFLERLPLKEDFPRANPASLATNVMRMVNENYVQTKEVLPDYEIRASQILKIINDLVSGDPEDRERGEQITLITRILKLYKPTEEVNDVNFSIRHEKERKRVEDKFGLTILYTNDDNINKYIHLPFSELKEWVPGHILLSEIIKYLKPLENLNHKFFMNHSSCRIDDEYEKRYNPKLSSLTRGISTPKEEVHKDCFINYFEEPQRKEVRRVLSRFPTLIDYYQWLSGQNREAFLDGLNLKTPLLNYIDILIEYGEGSPELYKFIMENH
jgi:hypothetical protein